MAGCAAKSRTYEVYGVFCSINCAKKFVLDQKGYDQSQVLMQLNEMCADVFGLPANLDYTAKAAPARFFLLMFGGSMSIDEFRKHSLHAHTLLVMPPFVAHAMIMESRSTTDNGDGNSTSNANEDEEKAGMEGRKRGTTAGAGSITDAPPSVEVEPLCEGKHILHGLRRPTRPAPAPAITHSEGSSRFNTFLEKQQKVDAFNSATAAAAGCVRPLKKPRKKDPLLPVPTGGKPTNTLASFLVTASCMEEE